MGVRFDVSVELGYGTPVFHYWSLSAKVRSVTVDKKAKGDEAMNTAVKFSRPPITEVVFQVNFPVIEGLGTPHFGLFWSQLRSDFPTVQSAGRLGPINLVGGANIFPENRVWLVHKSGSTIVQLQDDRFLFNWRLTGQDDSYPGYDNLYPEFKKYFGIFLDFLDSENFGIEAFSGFELHYVNHIYMGDSFDKWEKAGNAVVPFRWSDELESSALKSIRLQTASEIDESNDMLTVLIDSRTHNITKESLLNFEIRVAGQRDGLTVESLDDVFSHAHDQALTTFLSMSTSDIKGEWDQEG